MRVSSQPSAHGSASTRRTLLSFFIIVSVIVAARLPFLLHADRFFDADEAVEGLMARHVLLGEHPLFLWGQRYKGVPEIYLTAAVFRVMPPSVVALKAVTLFCFAGFVYLNFRLLERVCSRATAWIATAFLAAGPPSLVLWTLSGSAELVMTLIAGAALLLFVAVWVDRGSSRALLLGSAALGFGLWVQQFILYFLVTLAIAAAIAVPGWRTTVREQVRARVPSWLKVVTTVLAIGSALYIVLGLVAFVTGGVQFHMAGARISVTHPQKMWWIAGATLAGSLVVVGASVFRARAVAPVLAFLVGYSPAVIGRIGNHGLGAPISRLDVMSLRSASPDIVHRMLPILFGWSDPAGRATVPEWCGAVIVFIAFVSYVEAWRRKGTSLFDIFFHVFPLVVAGVLLVSGSYVDAQSYRYLMPIYAALPVVYATGIVAIWRASRLAGSAVLVMALSIFVAQQVSWYKQLSPDLESQHAIACLDSKGIQAARAGYWQSYKLTFLTNERVLVSPVDGLDRYVPYSARTSNAPRIDSILAKCD